MPRGSYLLLGSARAASALSSSLHYRFIIASLHYRLIVLLGLGLGAGLG